MARVRQAIILASSTFAVICTLHAECHAASTAWPSVRWSEPASQDPNQDRAELTASESSVPLGGVLEVRALLHSGRQSDAVYNPFFDPDFLAPARLVVFDARKQYVADVLPFREPARLPPYSAWFPMSEANVFGRRLRVRIADRWDRSASQGRHESELAVALTPGKYYLQLIYTNRLRSIRPGSVYSDPLQRWLSPYHNIERLRSRAVEIEILAGPAKQLDRQADAIDSAATPKHVSGRVPESGGQRVSKPNFASCELGLTDLPSIAGIPQPTSPLVSDFQLLEQEDLDCGNCRGRVTISVPQRKLVSRKDSLVVQVVFENTSDRGYCVNTPTSISRVLMFEPEVLAIFDHNKKCLGDLLTVTWLHGGNPAPSAWKYLPAGAICGTSWRTKAGSVFPSARNPTPLLPAGKYYLQLVYLERFIAPPPGSDVEPPPADAGPEALEEYKRRRRTAEEEWHARYGRPLFRSNIVEIELLDKPDAPPIATTNGLPIR